MIAFEMTELSARFVDISGKSQRRIQQVRTDPITLKQSRITPSRSLENERGTEKLYQPPKIDLDESRCPFCAPNLEAMTPCLDEKVAEQNRLVHNESVLFPNLFPYTEWSAVSIFDASHHVEIGSADPAVYRDSFINCSDYLCRVKRVDPAAIFMSITQNHLPGAGGSLVHPHLQVHATRHISNNHAVLQKRVQEYRRQYDNCIFSDLLKAEQQTGVRYIGSTGLWKWVAAFAPSGFYEIWGIATSASSLLTKNHKELLHDLARGVLNVQRFYRSINRNAYNLGLVSIEDDRNLSSLRVSLTARSSYAPWVRSDFTGFELASGEMATFSYPESVATRARDFWK